MKNEYKIIYQEVIMHEFAVNADSYKDALSEFNEYADSCALDFSDGDLIYGGIVRIEAPSGDAKVYDKSYSDLEFLAENPDKVHIPLGDGFNLVAEKNSDPDYKEIFVYLQDSDGLAYQDLAIVGESYTYDEDNVVPVHSSYSVKVYSDPDDECYQRDYTFGRRQEA